MVISTTYSAKLFAVSVPASLDQVTADVERWQANDAGAARIRMPTYEWAASVVTHGCHGAH
jgi:hypothetical protein